MNQRDLLRHDFCPWANKYVYWLKQPIGWFVVAMMVSVLVGAFANPIGWTLAIGLATILLLGLAFPWLAVRLTQCELNPLIPAVHEQQATDLLLTVRNPLPIPIWGLTIDGYLTQSFTQSESAESERPADIGLASVPPLSNAAYRLHIRPQYRGRYPLSRPVVSCSFPLGIWTAKRPIAACQRITVWPLLLPLTGMVEVMGRRRAEVGLGSRVGSIGDFLGVRDFRRGDSLRSIHWAQTARTGDIVVCERGGPQLQTVHIELSTTPGLGSAAAQRENLAWRVRIAASLVDLLSSRQIPYRLMVDGVSWLLPQGVDGLRAAFDHLADLPLDGQVAANVSSGTRSAEATCISISATHVDGSSLSDRFVRLTMIRPSQSLRSASSDVSELIDLDWDIATSVDQFLTEACHVAGAA